MPTAEKAVQERNCTQMPVTKRKKKKKDQTTNVDGKRKIAALIRQANS